jgi:hypothetical protein
LPDPPTFFAERPQPTDALGALTQEGRSGDLLSGLLRTVKLRGDGAVHLAPSPPFAIEFGETTAVLHIFETGWLRAAHHRPRRAVRRPRWEIVLLSGRSVI